MHRQPVLESGCADLDGILVLEVWRPCYFLTDDWIVANLATLLILLPLLLPAMGNFLHSQRSEGLALALLGRFSVPALLAN